MSTRTGPSRPHQGAPRGAVGAALILIAVAAFPACFLKPIVPDDLIRARADRAESTALQWKKGAEKTPLLAKRMSLMDAVKVALVHNKDLQSSIDTREIARGGAIGSFSELLPSVDLGFGFLAYDSPIFLQVGGIVTDETVTDIVFYALSVTQPLYRGGAARARVRAARLAQALAEEHIRSAVERLVHTVALDYYSVLLAAGLQEANAAAVTSARAHLRDVINRRDRGLASEYEVLRAQVDLSNFHAEFIQARNRRRVGMAKLLRDMGVSQQSKLTLTDELEYVPVDADLEQSVRSGLANRPDIFSADIDVSTGEEGLREARASYQPSVDGTLSVVGADTDPFENGGGTDALVSGGVVVKWPIFKGMARRGAVIAAHARLEQIRSERLSVEDRALLEVTDAVLRIEDAAQFVLSQNQNLKRSREALRLVDAGYARGLNSEVEVVDARSAVTRARSLYYQALFDHSSARLDLELATGALAPRPGRDEAGFTPSGLEAPSLPGDEKDE